MIFLCRCSLLHLPLLSSKIVGISISRVVIEGEPRPYSPLKNLSKVLATLFSPPISLYFEFIGLKTSGFSIELPHFHEKGLKNYLMFTQE